MVFRVYITGFAGRGPYYGLIAQNKEVADEWWRSISDSDRQNNRTERIKRLSPVLYSHDGSDPGTLMPEFSRYVHISKISPSGRIEFMDLAWARENLKKDDVDPISGKPYYIGSKNEPKAWLSHTQFGEIRVREYSRSIFYINIENGEEGSVMIGSDTLLISNFDGEDLSLRFHEGHKIVFGNFKADFGRKKFEDPAAEGVLTRIDYLPGKGEEWKLVPVKEQWNLEDEADDAFRG